MKSLLREKALSFPSFKCKGLHGLTNNTIIISIKPWFTNHWFLILVCRLIANLKLSIPTSYAWLNKEPELRHYLNALWNLKSAICSIYYVCNTNHWLFISDFSLLLWLLWLLELSQPCYCSKDSVGRLKAQSMEPWWQPQHITLPGTGIDLWQAQHSTWPLSSVWKNPHPQGPSPIQHTAINSASRLTGCFYFKWSVHQ